MPVLREFGCHLLTYKYDLEKTIEHGVLLDKLNFDHIRVGDHVLTLNPRVQYPNAHTMLTAIGILTKRVKLFPSVTDPYRRHPVEIAQAISTLDLLTKGRAALGIGGGEMMNLSPFGIEWVKPYSRLRESIEVIKLLWSASPQDRINYKGEIFTLRDAYLQIRPMQKPRPPIYVGAVGPRTRALVGEMADGWIPVIESPETLKVHLKDVLDSAARCGRRSEEIEVDVSLYTDISEHYEAAYRCVEATAKSGLIQERAVLGLMGCDLQVPDELSVQRLRADEPSKIREMEKLTTLIPRRIVEEVTAFGSPDQCIGRIEEFLKAGATSITICDLGPEKDRTYEVYAKKIVPYLKQQYAP
jgi:alkanesulfonate monooxygenase SsuD/methylene tetrahydromethanopterin reductase-like flavin-dependent oxidoreductase (luciferase family)